MYSFNKKMCKVKVKIPVALREQVWITYFGRKYEHKCYIRWCKNNIDVFNFQVGHNIPESKGGLTLLENLRPICIRCNQSMSNVYTIDEWNKFGNPKPSLWSRLNSCLSSICCDNSKSKNLGH
jgi:hypothetical protein